MSLQKERNLQTWLFKPFTYIAGEKALLWGLAIILLTSASALLTGMHTDGVIDIHFSTGPAWTYFVEGLVNLTVMFMVLWPLASFLSPSKVRWIDILGTQALARAPLFFVSLTGFFAPYEKLNSYAMTRLAGAEQTVEMTGMDWTLFALASLILLAGLVWMIALMWQGFKISGNLKGAPAVIGFIAGLLLAEIVSKFTLSYLFTSL